MLPRCPNAWSVRDSTVTWRAADVVRGQRGRRTGCGIQWSLPRAVAAVLSCPLCPCGGLDPKRQPCRSSDGALRGRSVRVRAGNVVGGRDDVVLVIVVPSATIAAKNAAEATDRG
jgi:hypothetical protein